MNEIPNSMNILTVDIESILITLTMGCGRTRSSPIHSCSEIYYYRNRIKKR